MVVFGLEHYVYGMHRIHELGALVEAAGGVMIGAHPYRRQLSFELRNEGDWSEALDRAVANPAYAHVAAIETLNGRGSSRENAFAAEIASRLGTRQAAASDAHAAADVGRCATEFERRIAGLIDLIAELKSGRFHPLDLTATQWPNL